MFSVSRTSFPKKRPPKKSNRCNDRPDPVHPNSLAGSFDGSSSEPRVVVHCPRVAVVLSLRHPSSSITRLSTLYRSSPTPLPGVAAPGSQSVHHVAHCLPFHFFTLQYVRVQIYWLFYAANLLRNKGDTAAEAVVGLCDPASWEEATRAT